VNEGTLTAFTSDGATFSWVGSDTSTQFIYVAIGGNLDVKAHAITCPNTITNFSSASLGFAPVASEFAMGFVAAAGAASNDAQSSFGAALSSSAQFAGYARSESAQTTSDAWRYQAQSASILQVGNTGSISVELDFVSNNADTITLNTTNPPGSAQNLYCISYGSVQAHVDNFTQQANGINSITGVGFQPETTFFSGVNASTSDAAATQNCVNLGVGSDSSAAYTWTSDQDNVATTNSAKNGGTLLAFKMASPTTQANQGDMSYTSSEPDGFDVTWANSDGSARVINFLSLADAGGGGASAAVTIPKPIFSSAAQSIAPIFNAAVSFTVSKPVFASTAQSVAPGNNGDVSFLIAKPVFASTAQALVPIVSGSIAFAIGKPEFAATAQAIPAGAGANASIFINKPVFASTAQSMAPIITGDVAFSISAPIFSATGQALGPNTNADASIVISKPQFNAAAQAIGVDNNAAISFNIASPIFSIFAGGAVLEYYYAKGTQIVLIEKSTIIKAPNKSRTLGV
jgi:hypothetical protein